MAISTVVEPVARLAQARRVDVPAAAEAPWTWPIPPLWETAAFAVLAMVFTVLGAGVYDLDPSEGRLGLAAGEGMGPLGQVFGYWAPDVWPVQLASGIFLASFETLERPVPGSIRWPAAVAGVLIGMILWRGGSRALGSRGGLVVALVWLSSIGLVDRSALTGLDLVQALFVIGAIDRVRERGKDLTMGLWTALGFLAGGWPPVVMIGLAMIVIDRPERRFSLRPYIPPLVAMIGWSLWTIAEADSEAWAAALTLPLTRKPEWMLGLGVLLSGLPWSPLAFFVGARSVRDFPSPAGLGWTRTWIQVAAAALVAGTLVPGLGSSARGVALVGFTAAAALVVDAAWSRRLQGKARTAFFVVFSGLIVLWLTAVDFGGYVWIMTMPYYRAFGVVMVLLGFVVAVLAWASLAWGNTRRALSTLVLAAIGLKMVHACYYVPEWNYRRGQGPWARAVAQWIPRRAPVYTFHEWPADFAFYLKRHVRQLRSPEYMRLQPQGECKFMLLLESEFANWPDSAMPIVLVARFLDAQGGGRVLARTTDGPTPLLGPKGPQKSVELSMNDGF